MIYKNGFKEYSLSALLFGIPMGLIMGVSKLSVLVGIITGIFSGLLFAFLIFLFVKIQEKKFDKKREEIKKERRVICDGGATLSGNGGWLFLTERGLEFYPHKLNFSTKNVMLPINAIKDVKTRKNLLVVSTADTPSLEIVVSHVREWKKQIDETLASLTQEV